MKHFIKSFEAFFLLVALLILLSETLRGQANNSNVTLLDIRGERFTIDTFEYKPEWYLIDNDTITTNYDDVPVLLLVTDTTHFFRTKLDLTSCTDTLCAAKFNHDHWNDVREDCGPLDRTFTIRGFEVIRHTVFEEITYLDEDKKPLNPNYVVWQTVGVKSKFK